MQAAYERTSEAVAKKCEAGIEKLHETYLHEIARLTAIIEEHKLAEATAVENIQATVKTARCIGVQTWHDEGGTWVTKAAAAKQEQALERRVHESFIKAVEDREAMQHLANSDGRLKQLPQDPNADNRGPEAL